MIGTAIALTAAALAAGGSVAGGAIAANGAKGAAKTQAQAAQQVGASARQTSNEVAGSVSDAANNAANGVDDATAKAIEAIRNGTVDANKVLQGIYETAGTTTQPFREAGAAAVNKLSGLADQQFNYDANSDPGTQFRLQEAQKALERSASARGSLLSGGQLKSLTRYTQGIASEEYGKAFDRFQTNRNNTGTLLSGLVNAGTTANSQYLAAGQNFGNNTSDNITRGSQLEAGFGVDGAKAAGGFRVGGAESAGNFRMQGESISGNAATGAANATAAGQVASGNAWGSAINGAANAPIQAILLSQLMKQNPTTGTR